MAKNRLSLDELKAGGKYFMYHNHDGEFKKVNGKTIMDHMAEMFPADELGFTILGLTFSPVKGPAGNIEFLGHLPLADVEGIEPDTADVVAQAHQTLD